MEKMKENELLQLALEALRNNLPGQAEIKTVKPVRDPRVACRLPIADSNAGQRNQVLC